MPVYTYTALDDPLATNQPGFGTGALGINDGAQIVGYYENDASGATYGFLLSAGVYTTLDLPGSSSANGINGTLPATCSTASSVAAAEPW